MGLIFFFFLLALSFVFQNPLEHHIHILRKGTVALFREHLDSFYDVMIQRKAYILFHVSIPFVAHILRLIISHHIATHDFMLYNNTR